MGSKPSANKRGGSPGPVPAAERETFVSTNAKSKKLPRCTTGETGTKNAPQKGGKKTDPPKVARRLGIRT